MIKFDMPDIWQIMSDSWTIPLKQNVRCHGGICPENFQLYEIQNGRPSAIINFIMPDIRQYVGPARQLDHYYKTKYVVSRRDIPGKTDNWMDGHH